MANPHSSPTGTGHGCQVFVLNETEDIVLTDASENSIGTVVVQIDTTGSGGGIVFKHRVRGSGLGAASWKTCLVYTDDAETVLAAGTSNTAEKIYIIPTDGCDLCASYTQDTGSMTLYVQKVRG